jgi:hypothetical protein
VTWRAARSLTVLHEQLQRGAPAAAPPATSANAWGTVGDVLHDPSSDHSPHDFPGWGNEIVTAADFPNAPELGLDAHAVLDDIRRARDPRAKYGISNAQIFSNHPTDGYGAWEWRPYSGSDDMHYGHGHLSVVGDERADGEQPWPTLGEDDDMGGSFGPVLMRSTDTEFPLVIPPVQGGIADPRETWLNLGIDFGGPAFLRIWASNGGGGFSPLPGHPDGVVRLASGAVFSQQLAAGVRLLSVLRVPDPAAAPPAAVSVAPVSICFERK